MGAGYLFPNRPAIIEMPTRGRPPGWFLDPNQPGPIYREVLAIDDRGRTTIPARARDRISWLRDDEQKLALIVCEEPGRVRFLPWDPYGQRVIKCRQELLKLERTPEVIEEILEMEDRYIRQSIETNGRVNLSEMALTHLDIISILPNQAILVCLVDIVEIWTNSYRRRRRKTALDTFADLP